MSERSPFLLLDDLITSGQKILEYTYNLSYNQFLSDEKTIDAVIRNFEIIVEVVNRLPDEFKKKHSEIDWHRIRGFRNRIVHDYFGIDYEIVWEIKEKFLPELITVLKSISDSLQE